MSETLSEKMQARMEKARAEAHKRVIERGLVQFRANKEMMEQLLTVSEHKNTPIGVLARSWIEPVLLREYQNLFLKEIMLPSGKILTSKSNIRDLQKANADFEKGYIELSLKAIETIKNWLRAEQDQPITKIILPGGRTLTANSPYSEIAAVYDAYKKEELELKPCDYNAIVDWAIKQGKRSAKAS